MKLLSLVAAILLLAACSSSTTELDPEKEFADRCTGFGLQPDTPDYNACIDNERQKRLVQRSAGRLY